jgi:hypothetical protein
MGQFGGSDVPTVELGEAPGKQDRGKGDASPEGEYVSRPAEIKPADPNLKCFFLMSARRSTASVRVRFVVFMSG